MVVVRLPGPVPGERDCGAWLNSTAFQRTIRIYAECYPEMDTASVGEALGEVWERIQDEAPRSAPEARL